MKASLPEYAHKYTTLCTNLITSLRGLASGIVAPWLMKAPKDSLKLSFGASDLNGPGLEIVISILGFLGRFYFVNNVLALFFIVVVVVITPPGQRFTVSLIVYFHLHAR